MMEGDSEMDAFGVAIVVIEVELRGKLVFVCISGMISDLLKIIISYS